MTASARDSCAVCRAPLPPDARFCGHCGGAIGAGRGRGRPLEDRAPWLLAAIAIAAALAGILVWLARNPAVPAQALAAEAPAAEAPADPGAPGAGLGMPGSPPDLSQMSPRERFDRLFDRIMRAATQGDAGTVTGFTPMALSAYAQLDTIDADARYDAALLRIHIGDVAGSEALADTILANAPDHLFGYMIHGSVAHWRKDAKSERAMYQAFLRHYPDEMKASRPEYQRHQTAVDDFRRTAELAVKGAGR